MGSLTASQRSHTEEGEGAPQAYRLFMLLALCVPLYVIGLGSISLTDSDEVFYAESAREMIASHSWLTPLIFGARQFEKPPLFYWLLITSFKMFGINAVSARLVSALFGTIGVLWTYILLKRVLSERVSFYSALVLGTSLFYVAVSRFVVTDMVFSVFVALSLYYFYLWYKLKSDSILISFGFFAGLAVLTKGPLGMAIALATIIVFFGLTRDIGRIRSFLFNRWWFIFLAVSLPWYLYATLRYGREFLWEFFVRDNLHRLLYAEHQALGEWYFYPAVIAVGFLPWTGYLAALGRNFKRYRDEYFFFLAWAGVVFLLTGLARSKLSGYILPLFPPVAVLIGIALDSLVEKTRLTTAVGILQIGFAVAVCAPLPLLVKSYPDVYAHAFLSASILSLTLAAAGLLLLRGRTRYAFRAIVVGTMLFVPITVHTIPPALETAFSNSDLKEVVDRYHYSGKVIVCNKAYMRGAYFFTGNPVVVIDTKKNPFWSALPLRVIADDSEVSDFFRGEETVLCVLQRSDVERLNRIFSHTRVQQVIHQNGERFVVASKRL